MGVALSLQWDVFCRVVDNHGDLGVCLRLARDLHQRGQHVRLWVDDARALNWMANSDEERNWARPWPDETWVRERPSDVVVETFGCHLPPCVEAALAAQPPRAWLNVEYLSAQAWVERHHGLASPVMQGPAAGLVKHFVFPGFSAATGGLLREPDLLPRMAGHDERWLEQQPWAARARAQARRVSLFCYPSAPLAALFERLAGDGAHDIWVAGGTAAHQRAQRAWEAMGQPVRDAIHLLPLPWLCHADYDRLLWSCDLNLVRGEDSLMRALWAGRPLLWQLYPQDDGAHADKLAAFLQRFALTGTQDDARRQSWLAWNGLHSAAALSAGRDDGLGPEGLAAAQAWRAQLLALPSLGAQLLQRIGINP